MAPDQMHSDESINSFGIPCDRAFAEFLHDMSTTTDSIKYIPELATLL
jgi:hypothetical protein